MVKIAISGYYGFRNFGDEAILSALVKHFKGNDITVFSCDPDYTSQTHGVKSVRNFDFKKVVETIKECDVLISGGGSLLQDVTSMKSLVYYASIIALGILFNKKVIIFAQGIGPINNKFAANVVKNLLKLCTLVTVRDEKSLEFIPTAKLVCDPVYLLETKCAGTENTVGIQLREFKTMNYNLLHKLALIVVTKFAPPHPPQCGTFSHERGEGGSKKIELFSLQETQDLELCRRFEHLLKTLNPDIETEIVTDDIINRISKLEYLIAMRFHAILAALKCGVKTCAINYDIKVKKLAQDAGLPLISMDAHENLEEIYNQMENLNKEELLRFANSKSFDWGIFDELFITE